MEEAVVVHVVEALCNLLNYVPDLLVAKRIVI
jgi:hypothetical protein